METIKFIDALENKTPESIRSTMYKKYILTNHNQEDNRMVLYSSKNTRFSNTLDKDENHNIWSECNGLILDTKNIKPLVIPPESFRTNIHVDVVDKYLANDLYKLYLVEDGTVINLYFWQPLNSWRISTTRCYDVTDVKWGNLTYNEILCDLLLRIYNTEYTDFHNMLDKDTSYTFGFKHESMHPFRENKSSNINKLWFIQSCTNNGQVSDEFENKCNIPNQTKFEFPEGILKNTKYLFNKIHHSFNDFISNGNILYGYILRSKKPSETGTHSNILLESSLLQKIRTLYYHSSFNENSKERKYNRDLYTIIHSYLDVNNRSIFIILFPQYINQYDKLGIITTILIKNINNMINSPNIMPEIISEYITTNNKTRSNFNLNTDILKKSVIFIYNSMTSVYKLNSKDRRNSMVISTYILNNNFIDLYYSLFSF